MQALIVTVSTVAFLLSQVGTGRGEDWPRFRGPTGLGYTQEKNLPLHWGSQDEKNILWKAPLVGQGHASPVVWGDSVFVCTALWPPDVRQREKVVPEQHVACYLRSVIIPLAGTRSNRGWVVPLPPDRLGVVGAPLASRGGGAR